MFVLLSCCCRVVVVLIAGYIVGERFGCIIWHLFVQTINVSLTLLFVGSVTNTGVDAVFGIALMAA
ncbi:MAG: hypothetical protein LBQ66_01795 [Planctomycetaceae bacterium]|jgi:hypothetical protein|nr:hypothetical protein [Planctomycetaceae bacterium]